MPVVILSSNKIIIGVGYICHSLFVFMANFCAANSGAIDSVEALSLLNVGQVAGAETGCKAVV